MFSSYPIASWLPLIWFQSFLRDILVSHPMRRQEREARESSCESPRNRTHVDC
jgi:hypothetical protein